MLNCYGFITPHPLLSNHKMAYFQNIPLSVRKSFWPIAALLTFSGLLPKDTSKHIWKQNKQKQQKHCMQKQ